MVELLICVPMNLLGMSRTHSAMAMPPSALLAGQRHRGAVHATN